MNVASGTRATLVPDIQGSVIASLDSTSGTLIKLGYLPYGKSASTGPFGFTGQRVDVETGGLHYYRARHYSPAWGRFLQVDPIRYGGGIHLYAYVGNDPLNSIDPFGLAADSPSSSDAPSWSQNDSSFAAPELFTAPAASTTDTQPVQLAAMDEDTLRGKTKLLDMGGGGGVGGGFGGSTSGGRNPFYSPPTASPPSPTGSTGSGPNFVVSPSGTTFPVPNGATGPSGVQSGNGFQFQGGSGGSGFSPNTTGVRIMDPVTTGPYQYPNGYGVYMNRSGQTVDPFTGRTILPNDPLAHIPR